MNERGRLHIPGDSSQNMNPLLVLATALDKANSYLHQIADNTKPHDFLHVYCIQETLKGWGIFCQACSHEANDYVWPCKEQDTTVPYPPQFLKIAEEPPAIKKAF